MTEFLTILFLAIVQGAIGLSILSLTGIKMRAFMVIATAVLIGVVVSSLSVFLLILLKIQLTSGAVFGVLAATVLLCIGISFKKLKTYTTSVFNAKAFIPKLYELPAIGLLVFMIFVSAWRCFYFPPTPRDLTSGPEVMAEYAVKEKTIANSVFTVNLESTNNQFKSPYITTLQILYKYAGFPFGQVWLSVIFGFFIMFLYGALASKIHPVLSGIACVWFVCIPEMYAYTIMALFDYSNAVYFAIGLYFLYESNNSKRSLALSGLFFALATYIRSETLVLVAFVAAIYAIQQLVSKKAFKQVALGAVIVGIPALILYFVSGSLYLNNYLPQKYDVGGLVNKNLGDLAPFSKRLSDIYNGLLFNGDQSTNLYGSFITFFIVIAALDIIVTIALKKEFWFTYKKALNWIGAALVVVVGLAFLGYLLPLMDLNNSTKRGLFKLFPVLLLYLMHSTTLQLITRKLKF